MKWKNRIYKIKLENKKIFKPLNTMIILTILIIISTLVLGTFYSLLVNKVDFYDNNFYPAIIPFSPNDEDCKQADKASKNENCLDYNHKSNF
jgi:hypothetical protein